MKATVDATEFRDAVVWAARILPKASAGNAILSGLHLEARDGELVISAFDYETSARATITATVGEPGSTLVAGDLLAGLAAKMPDGAIELTPNGGLLAIHATGTRASLPTMRVEDYPTLPPLPDEVGRLDATALREAVDRVAVAASKEETLPVLTAVRVELGATLALTATNRYRIAAAQLAWQRALDDTEIPPALVPALALRDIARGATGTISLHVGADQHDTHRLGASWAGRHIATRLLVGAFPPVQKFLGRAGVDIHVTVDREDLLAAVDRVAPTYVAASADPIVLAAGDGQLTLTMATSRGEASAEIAATYDGDPIEWRYNHLYLRDALRALHGDTVVIGLTDPVKPTDVLDPEDEAYQHVIMPIRGAA